MPRSYAKDMDGTIYNQTTSDDFKISQNQCRPLGTLLSQKEYYPAN